MNIRDRLNKVFPTQFNQPSDDSGWDRHLNVAFPGRLARRIALTALHERRSQSSFVREVMYNACMEVGESEQAIISDLAGMAIVGWHRILNEQKGKKGWNTQDEIERRYQQYHKQLVAVLRRRYLIEEDVQAIVSLVDENREPTLECEESSID